MAVSTPTVTITNHDHVKGSRRQPVMLLEYGDYECPYCGKAYYVIKELLRTHGEVLAYAFRNFPLADLHPHALKAALAAEAGGLQDKFWPMYQVIYENQSLLEDEYLVAYADEAGLDIDRFLDDIKSAEIADKVQRDIDSGLDSGVDSTPSFFINGQPYTGPYDLGILSIVIDHLAAGTNYKKVKDNYELSRSKQ